MKGLKKLTLASAIAVAPFASQALEALDDATMGDVTGQAGVTIDISIEGAGITVGEITYTDTATADDPLTTGVNESLDVDTNGDGDFDARSGGSVVLQDLNISGIDNLTQTIDVLEDGDLFMTTTGVTGVEITLGDDATNATVNDRSALAISGSAGTAEIINDLSITMDLGASTTRIHNMANTDTLAAAGVTGTAGAGWAPLAIQAQASFEITDMSANIFGYTESDAARKTAGDLAAAAGGGAVWTDYATVDGATGEVSLTTAAEGTALPSGATGAQAAAARANGGAIGIRGLSFSNPLNADGSNDVVVSQTIWADAGGVNIQVGQIQGTLAIDAIEIGGASIGSVSVSGINLAGLTQTIRGH